MGFVQLVQDGRCFSVQVRAMASHSSMRPLPSASKTYRAQGSTISVGVIMTSLMISETQC